jgi:hypothetical protein
MSLVELLVLAAAVLLGVVVLAEGKGGTLAARAGMSLLTLAMLAAVVALLRMLAQ